MWCQTGGDNSTYSTETTQLRLGGSCPALMSASIVRIVHFDMDVVYAPQHDTLNMETPRFKATRPGHKEYVRLLVFGSGLQ